MKIKFLSYISFATLILLSVAYTASAEMLLFVREDCQHCKDLDAELAAENLYQKLNIQTFEISGQDNQLFYIQKSKELDYDGTGVPLLIDGSSYREGTSAILAYLEGQEEATVEGESHLSAEEAKELVSLLEDQPSTSASAQPSSTESTVSPSYEDTSFFTIKNTSLLALAIIFVIAVLVFLRSRFRK
ncbi:hypothetical protein HY605_03295 [Candidatus Peregrinibacteria bacterium]|nr:hypothetical protein [Candidatus Peregrinibacteria bacterium]